MPIRLKICCISSIDETRIAIKNGADALGLVAEMPSGPGIISEDLIAEIANFIPPPLTSVLLTSHQSTSKIIAQHSRCRTNAIQICDRLIEGNYENLRKALPGISLIQVIHISGPESMDEALNHARFVDALLLDSGRKTGSRVELGGTGRTHNWEISAQICQRVKIPIFLAGGLTPDNVKEAIEIVRPFAVDVCSGVRTDGSLDENKVAAFIKNVRGIL